MFIFGAFEQILEKSVADNLSTTTAPRRARQDANFQANDFFFGELLIQRRCQQTEVLKTFSRPDSTT